MILCCEKKIARHFESFLLAQFSRASQGFRAFFDVCAGCRFALLLLLLLRFHPEGSRSRTHFLVLPLQSLLRFHLLRLPTPRFHVLPESNVSKKRQPSFQEKVLLRNRKTYNFLCALPDSSNSICPPPLTQGKENMSKTGLIFCFALNSSVALLKCFYPA